MIGASTTFKCGFKLRDTPGKENLRTHTHTHRGTKAMIKGAVTQRTASLCRTALHSCRDAVRYIYKKRKRKGVCSPGGEKGGEGESLPGLGARNADSEPTTVT